MAGLTALALRADEPKLVSETGSIEFDAAGTVEAKGGATFTHDALTVLARDASYDRNTRRAAAVGDVRLTRGDFRVVSDALIYEAEGGEMVAETFRMGEHPLYIEGTGLSGTTERVEFGDATIFFSEPHPLGPNIRARRVVYYPGERIEGEGLTFRIGEVPYFYLPRYSQRVDEEEFFHFRGRAGYRSNLGLFVQTESRQPVSEHLSIGPLVDLYTQRGLLVGPSVGYAGGEEGAGAFYEGTLTAAYINDFGEKDLDVTGRDIDEGRYFTELRHRQGLTEDWDLTSSLSIWSDSEVLRDFRDGWFDDDQQPDNFVESVYRTENSFVSVFLRADPNNFQLIQERLPEVRYDLMPTPAPNSDFYHAFSASYARLEEDALRNAGPDLESDRFDAFYRVFRAVEINPWLDLVPVAGFRVTHYDDTVDDRGTFTRMMGQVGFDLEASAHRSWDVKSEIWQVDGLRHILRPVVQYRYLPGGKYGNRSVVPIDDEVFTTSIPPIDLSNIRYLDELTDLNVLRFGVENLLQTREPGYGSRDLVQLDAYQDLRFSGDEEGDEWGDFYTRLGLFPAHWLRLHLYQRFDPEDLTLEEVRTRLGVTDGDIWTLGVGTVALDGEIDQYQFDYSRKFNETWGFRVRLRLDAKAGEVTRQIYGIRQRVGNTWDVEYRLSIHSGASRESSASFKVHFDLLKF